MPWDFFHFSSQLFFAPVSQVPALNKHRQMLQNNFKHLGREKKDVKWSDKHYFINRRSFRRQPALLVPKSMTAQGEMGKDFPIHSVYVFLGYWLSCHWVMQYTTALSLVTPPVQLFMMKWPLGPRLSWDLILWDFYNYLYWHSWKISWDLDPLSTCVRSLCF